MIAQKALKYSRSVATASGGHRYLLLTTGTRSTASAIVDRYSTNTTTTSCHKLPSRSMSSSNNSPSNLNDYFGTLRMKAAQALTSSMDDDEKTALLERMGATVVVEDDDTNGLVAAEDDEDDDDDHDYQHTIDEAVAAAKAKEAERYEEKWELEKEKLIAEAEEAARRRVESDLEIQRRQVAFEAWKRDLERDQEEQNNESNQNGIEEQTDSSSSRDEVLGEHPILGPVLADFGSKRIHTASARALSAIPVWKKQRIYRHGRAKLMAKDKLKSMHLGLPGVIGLYEGKDGSLRIIDGQHRIGMLKSMEESAAADGFDFDNILVEVYPQKESDKDNDAHAKEIFMEINKAEPVKLVDLPGVAKASDRKIINEGADRLQDRFPDMFSTSQRCRAPHLNIDNLRDALFASTVLQRHTIKTSKALEEWMMTQNEILSTKYQSDEHRQLVPSKALAKAEKYHFYLGLDSSWLYN